MRAKYKLGNLVKAGKREEEPAHFGIIEGILLTENGAKYRVLGLDDDIEESEILSTYREIKPRQSKPRKQKAKAAKE